MNPRPQPDTRWIRALRATPSARRRLVCLPHAGGTASFFRNWADGLPPDVDLWAIQYPGRENRISEPFLSDMDTLAQHLADELSRFLDLPTVFFGHSMGAAVGYEVLRRLTAADSHHAVRHLVVSACAAPHRVRPFAGQEGAHALDDDQLVAVLKQLGTVGADLLDDPDMRPVLLPAIRNDYALVQSYTGCPGPALRTDVTALSGRQDESVGADDLRAWAEATQGAFALRSFPGGHFYLVHHQDEVLQAVNHVLTAC